MPALSQILGKRVSYLLDMTAYGAQFRFTTAPRPIGVVDADGVTRVYSAGMAPMSIMMQVGVPLDGVGVSILSVGATPWSSLVARGVRLMDARCVVRRHYDGMTLEEAEIVIRGKATAVSYGDRSEPLTFSIARRLAFAGEIPSPDMRVSTATWSVSATATPDEQADGAYYPVNFGTPGFITGLGGASGSAIGRTPGLMVELFPTSNDYFINKIMIAGHAVVAPTVSFTDRSAGLGRNGQPVQTMADKLGRTISYVDFSGLRGRTDPGPSPGHEWAISWTDGGGIPMRDDPTKAMTGLGDIARYLLEDWTSIEIDRGKMEAHRSRLNGYDLSFSITSPTGVWSFIRSHITSLLPLEWVDTPSGGYFLPWRLDATAVDVVGKLDSTPKTGNVTRTSAIVTAGEVANKITLQYARGGPQDRHLKRLTIQGDEDESDPTVIASAVAKRSQTLLVDLPNDNGIRPMTLTTDVVQDDATAAAVLRDLVLRHSVSRRALQVQGGHDLDVYHLGDILELTDSDVDITAELVQIRAITRDDIAVHLDLLTLDHPYISSRATT